jgi:hypothetical protein
MDTDKYAPPPAATLRLMAPFPAPEGPEMINSLPVFVILALRQPQAGSPLVHTGLFEGLLYIVLGGDVQSPNGLIFSKKWELKGNIESKNKYQQKLYTLNGRL